MSDMSQGPKVFWLLNQGVLSIPPTPAQSLVAPHWLPYCTVLHMSVTSFCLQVSPVLQHQYVQVNVLSQLWNDNGQVSKELLQYFSLISAFEVVPSL